MDPHSVELPKKILVGKGVLNAIPQLLKELKLSNPLVLADSFTSKIAGERIARDLKGEKARLEIMREPTNQEAERIARDFEAGVVIAAGGGSVIDVGKVAALKMRAEFICVPTAPSHDGIVSAMASLSDKGQKGSFQGKMPVAIVADIDLLRNAPQRMVSAGFADAVSNITAVWDWKLASRKGEYYSEYAASLSLLAAETAIKSARLIASRSERGIRDLMEALITSGVSMALAGSSRPASGAEHTISHVLDSMGAKALHGEQCGVASIVTAYLQGQDWIRLRKALREGGAPSTAKGLGLNEREMVSAIVKARDFRKRHTILNELAVGQKEAKEACRKTGVC